MDGSIIAGFVKGASEYGADQIKQRQAAEQELQKTKLLESLRLDTEKEMATFKDNLDKNDVSKDMSSPDYTSGKLVYRNKNGDIVGGRQLTPDEIQAHSMDQQKDSLGLDNIRSEMAARTQSAANDSARLGLDRQRVGIEAANSKREAAKDGLDTRSAAGQPLLLKEYSNAVNELTKAGANPSVLANFQTKWYEGVNQAGWSPAQQRKFLDSMRRSFTDKHNVDGHQVDPLLQRFNSANSSLDAKLSGTDNSPG